METVSSEYLIGYALIELMKKGYNTVAVSDLRQLGEIIQQKLNSMGADVIIERSYIVERARSFTHFFEVLNINNEYYIKARDNQTVRSMTSRWYGYHTVYVMVAISDICASYTYKLI